MTLRYVAPPCPACGGTMHNEPVRNALSRHVDLLICTLCGRIENDEGWFWEVRYDTNSFALHAVQKKWREGNGNSN
jgi:hypothetical protein